jgi:uncharacterized protein YciI
MSNGCSVDAKTILDQEADEAIQKKPYEQNRWLSKVSVRPVDTAWHFHDYPACVLV